MNKHTTTRARTTYRVTAVSVAHATQSYPTARAAVEAAQAAAKQHATLASVCRESDGEEIFAIGAVPR